MCVCVCSHIHTCKALHSRNFTLKNPAFLEFFILNPTRLTSYTLNPAPDPKPYVGALERNRSRRRYIDPQTLWPHEPQILNLGNYPVLGFRGLGSRVEGI